MTAPKSAIDEVRAQVVNTIIDILGPAIPDEVGEKLPWARVAAYIETEIGPLLARVEELERERDEANERIEAYQRQSDILTDDLANASVTAWCAGRDAAAAHIDVSFSDKGKVFAECIRALPAPERGR